MGEAMIVQHKELAEGRWNNFTLAQQMANIGAEVGRAINWRKKGKIPGMERLGLKASSARK